MGVIIQNFISFFSNELNRNVIYLFFKNVFLILSIFLTVGVAVLFIKALKFGPKIKVLGIFKSLKLADINVELGHYLIKEKWSKILEQVQSNSPADFSLAIIGADSLVDDILKEKGLSGKDMGERLKMISREQLSTLDELWAVHKLRNKIAHNYNIKLTGSETKKALRIYYQVLKELNVL